MNAKGEFQDTVAIEKLSKGDNKEKIEKLVNGCKTTTSTNPCEKAYNIYECYIKAKAL